MEKNRFILKQCDLQNGARKDKIEGADRMSVLATCCEKMEMKGYRLLLTADRKFFGPPSKKWMTAFFIN